MMNCRFYDPVNRRLIYEYKAATPGFWDNTWEHQFPSRADLIECQNTQWSRITQEFLKPEQGVVLEGGCGMGMHVAALHYQGFGSIGVDFAPQTVAKLNSIMPELDIRKGDVRSLDFPDDYFSGYWSLGVIEHFWKGYVPIANEAYRVLKPGGIMFLAYPYLSPVRQWKSWLRLIPRWNGEEPEAFYQFALNTESVQKDFEALGFKLLESRPILGRQGMEEAAPHLASFLEKLYTSQQRNVFFPIFRKVIHRISSRCLPLFSYSMLLILEKPVKMKM